jgi:hypothetical protein
VNSDVIATALMAFFSLVITMRQTNGRDLSQRLALLLKRRQDEVGLPDRPPHFAGKPVKVPGVTNGRAV